MSSVHQTVRLDDRESFKHWTKVTIRFSDQDSMGHVNHLAIGAYIEASRTMLIGGLISPFKIENLDFILANVSISYLRELHYPGAVDVGGRIIRVGNKSITTGYGVFLGNDCIATSECVNVFYDMARRASVAPPESVRQVLLAAMGNGDLNQ